MCKGILPRTHLLKSTKKQQQGTDNFSQITVRKLEHEIKTMKKDKTPGQNHNRSLQKAATIIYQKLANLFTTCLKENKLPEEWNAAIK